MCTNLRKLSANTPPSDREVRFSLAAAAFHTLAMQAQFLHSACKHDQTTSQRTHTARASEKRGQDLFVRATVIVYWADSLARSSARLSASYIESRRGKRAQPSLECVSLFSRSALALCISCPRVFARRSFPPILRGHACGHCPQEKFS